jgi:5-methylcytosine-specific restriction enzyme A
MNKTPRIPIPLEVRKYVFERDRYSCQSCGKNQTQSKLTVDHIIALAQGGTNDLSNLQTLCSICNGHKYNKHDFRFHRRFSD